MAGIREIKRRIRAVKSIQQITRAMQMVAAARLRKAQERVVAARPYANKMDYVMGHLSAASRQIDHPLLQEHDEVKKIAVVAIASNRGLCGSYNTNLFRIVAEFVRSKQPTPCSLYLYGNRAVAHFKRRNYDIAAAPELYDKQVPWAEVRSISRSLQSEFVGGEYDEVYLIYTRFISTISYKAQVVRLLPITGTHAEGEDSPRETDYIFEPDAAELLGSLFPRYVDTQLYHALLESLASEQGARMTSMQSATDKAGDMIRELTLSYNKARQTTITKELLEIVSGAEALNQ
jgi:F-type H+-transporting ATPase subunit gamma